MYMDKTYDDPDKVRPPQRGNNERRIGQEEKYITKYLIRGQSLITI